MKNSTETIQVINTSINDYKIKVITSEIFIWDNLSVYYVV